MPNEQSTTTKFPLLTSGATLWSSMACSAKIHLLEVMHDGNLTPSEQRRNNYGMDLMFYIALPSFLYVYSLQKKASEKIAKVIGLSASAIVFTLNDGFGFANHKAPEVFLDTGDLLMIISGNLIFLLCAYIDIGSTQANYIFGLFFLTIYIHLPPAVNSGTGARIPLSTTETSSFSLS